MPADGRFNSAFKGLMDDYQRFGGTVPGALILEVLYLLPSFSTSILKIVTGFI